MYKDNTILVGLTEIIIARYGITLIDLLVQGEAVEEGRHLQHARLNDAAKLL